MSDNEKRAHDLAVAICIDISHMKRQLRIATNDNRIVIDYFHEYMNAYEVTLEAFNENFPNGK